MSELYEVHDSSIHQRGVFAKEDIPAETCILQYRGEIITKKESERRGLKRESEGRKDGSALVYIFELTEDYDLDGNIEDNPAKYINHSCAPNCEAVNDEGEIWIQSTRPIKAGEELCYDYGYDLSDALEHPCKCGSPACVGYIVSRDKWSKLKKLLKRHKKQQDKNEQ